MRRERGERGDRAGEAEKDADEIVGAEHVERVDVGTAEGVAAREEAAAAGLHWGWGECCSAGGADEATLAGLPACATRDPLPC